MTFCRSILYVFTIAATAAAAPMPIDPLWKSEQFRRTFTASYGIDSRIEPQVSVAEQAVLETVAQEMAKEKRTEAILLLQSHAQLKDSAVMLFNLGNLLFEEEKHEAATASFISALKLYPNFRDAHRNLAVVLVQNEKIVDSEPHLRRALELGAQDGITLGLLGYCHENAERPQAALQAYRTAILTMPDELQWRLGEARSLLELNELAAAAAIFEELLDKIPGQTGIWANLADVRLQQGNHLLAIADLEVARRLGSLNPVEILSLGHLYLNESLYQRAMECYQDGLSSDPLPPLARATSAIEYLVRARRWNDAGTLVKKLDSVDNYKIQLTENPKAGTRLDRGKALIEFHHGDRREGARRIALVVDKNPLDAQALLLLAEFHQANQRIEHALMLLEQAAEVEEYKVEALRKHGGILARRGDYSGALPLLRQAHELDPDEALRKYIESLEKLVGMFDRK